MQQFLDMIAGIRGRIPGFNFTTDILVGFPGETDKQFEETAVLAEQVGFSHVHTFEYSIRNGTRAARMDDQMSEAVKTARSARIREISDANKRRYYQSLVGGTQRVLVEKISAGQASGYGQHYVPIAVPSAGLSVNQYVDAERASCRTDGEPLL